MIRSGEIVVFMMGIFFLVGTLFTSAVSSELPAISD
jgi:hypothetical protein